MIPKISRIGSFGLCIEPERTGEDINGLNIDLLRELVWNERLIVLRGFKTFIGAEDLAKYCERWGQISVWPFGKVLELVEHNNPEDHIFDNNYVPLHWDGMYRPQVPEFQLFHCVKAPQSSQGGENHFFEYGNRARKSFGSRKKPLGKRNRKLSKKDGVLR